MTFIDYDDTILDIQTVQVGSDAVSPDEPANQQGYHFTNWDKDYTNVQEDINVTAVYSP